MFRGKVLCGKKERRKKRKTKNASEKSRWRRRDGGRGKRSAKRDSIRDAKEKGTKIRVKRVRSYPFFGEKGYDRTLLTRIFSHLPPTSVPFFDQRPADLKPVRRQCKRERTTEKTERDDDDG